MDDPVVGALHALAEERGGDLRVEDGRRQHAEGVVENFHILRARMEHLDDGGVGQQVAQRSEVGDGYGVDDDALLGRGHLHQAQPRMVGALAEELGVHGDGVEGARPRAEPVKVIAGRDVHA